MGDLAGIVGYNAQAMMTLVLTFVLFLLVILLLAAVVSMSGRPLKGSCGGVGGDVCGCETKGLAQGSCDQDGEGRELITISAGPPKS